MTTARRDLVDVTVTRWYHCISRCVRQAYLMGEGTENRKLWIENRLKLLTENFSISVGGFAVLDNHLHVLCRLDPEDSLKWSRDEVVRRWIAIYPPRNLSLDDAKVVDSWVALQIKDVQRVEVLRQRLANLGWFMKALKEPLARMANTNDGCRGAFWAARYKSIAILDDEALLACSAYVDLNPLAAGMAETPESSKHTSFKQRVDHVRDQGKLDFLEAALRGSVAGSKAAGNIEQDHWLLPIENRRVGIDANSQDIRVGMLDSFSLGSYVLLVDYTGRLFRHGKARMNSSVKEIFQRLGSNEKTWSDRIIKMLGSTDLRGTCFATEPESIRKLAEKRGKRVANLSPQTA